MWARRKWSGAPPRSSTTVCSRSPSGRAEIKPGDSLVFVEGLPGDVGQEARAEETQSSPTSASAGAEVVALRAAVPGGVRLAAALKVAEP